MIRYVLATVLALTGLLPAACTSTKATESKEALEPKKAEAESQEAGVEVEEVEEVEVDAEAVQQEDGEDSDATQSSDTQEGQAEDDGDTSAAVELPCDLPVVNKSAAAVANPCLTTEEFIRSLDLSEEQIRKVENLSKSNRIAH